MVPRTSEVDQRNTHRLIPAQYAEGGISVLSRLTQDGDLLEGIYELDNATNDRLLAESDLLPGVDARELVFGIPSYRIINAAFCHAAPGGSRFSSSDRNAWYAAFEVETSIAEVSYHKQLWLREIGWDEEEVTDYADYLADFHAEFHDIRDSEEFSNCLDPNDYSVSRALAAALLASGSSGIVYPSVRRGGGTCIACFRPVLVTNVHRRRDHRIVFPDSESPPKVMQP